MQNPHPQWPWISQVIFYDDPPKAIGWLCEAFGFEVRLKVEGENGEIVHSELTHGAGVVMVAGVGPKPGLEESPAGKSPRSLDGANTQAMCVYVDDVDAHCERARAAGAHIFREPKTDDYGEEYGANRSYGAKDFEGHYWWFMNVARDPKAL